jgi:hypothetical protein
MVVEMNRTGALSSSGADGPPTRHISNLLLNLE